MTLLAELYATGGNAVIVPTLSFSCAAWVDAIHIARLNESFIAALETGFLVSFSAADFGYKLPRQAAEGNQSLQFTIAAHPDPAIAGDIEPLLLIDQALESGAKVLVAYREFVYGQWSAPARPAIVSTVGSYEFDGELLSFNTTYHDLTNTDWPALRYTANDFPGLKYV